MMERQAVERHTSAVHAASGGASDVDSTLGAAVSHPPFTLSTHHSSTQPPPTPSSTPSSPLLPRRSHCLIIYTGGTIGMKRSHDGSLAPTSGYLLSALHGMPELQHSDCPSFDLLEWAKPMDSSDFSPAEWVTLAREIELHYLDYDGFVILHGTDTLAYTASALSFMLSDLSKSVILTGSMIPLAAPVSDAKRNLIISLLCAANLDLPEVCIFFNNLLLRGNRARKLDPYSVNAFDSPNYPPLATMGTSIVVNRAVLLPPSRRRFSVSTALYPHISVLVMTPAFDDSLIQQCVAGSTAAQPKALVLAMLGSGNGPTHRSSFLDALRAARECGAAVVIITQCLRGSVDMREYEVGSVLAGLSVIDGRDMTVEAAVTKLSWLLGRGMRGEQLKWAMEADCRGELTVKQGQSYTINEHYSYLQQLLQAGSGRSGELMSESDVAAGNKRTALRVVSSDAIAVSGVGSRVGELLAAARAGVGAVSVPASTAVLSRL